MECIINNLVNNKKLYLCPMSESKPRKQKKNAPRSVKRS